MQNPNGYNDDNDPNQPYSRESAQPYPNEPPRSSPEGSAQSYRNGSTPSSPDEAAQSYYPNKSTRPFEQEAAQASSYQSTRPFSNAPNQAFPNGSQSGKRPSTARGFGTKGILALLLLLASVFGVGLFAGWQFASRHTSAGARAGVGVLQPGSTPLPTIPALTGDNVESVRENVIARVRPSVVQINVVTQKGGGLGSGVIIDQRGYIITNNHVIEGAQKMEVVLFDGSILPGQIVGTAPSDDLAVVKVDPTKANLTVATIGDSSKLRVGQEVLAIGNPLGITQTVTNGIVSALDRNVATDAKGSVLPGTIQTNAAINPGNSGGALVDLQGDLIGIPTLAAIDPAFKTPANGVGFAVPSNRVSYIAPQLITSGKVTHSGRASLGIQGVSIDDVVAAQYNLPIGRGVFVGGVTSGSPAAKAGLKEGDIIVQVDNKVVNDLSSLADALLSKSPGDTVSVQIYRGRQQQTINVTLGELPVS
ncbi:MAG TPA: trypsin-like peptidase domain-containing protein [Ktedonosporobacter sp.]|nr:trypsin-like peptidase domain-containing protein [Ktedonosporobacter sp.]